MSFFRGKAYSQYFDHLDRAGGFFYERWGDAPVHSIALGLFEDKSKIHWCVLDSRDLWRNYCSTCDLAKLSTTGSRTSDINTYPFSIARLRLNARGARPVSWLRESSGFSKKIVAQAGFITPEDRARNGSELRKRQQKPVRRRR